MTFSTCRKSRLALELAAEIFELEDLIDDCVGLLAPQAGTKGVDLVAAISPGAARRACLAIVCGFDRC